MLNYMYDMSQIKGNIAEPKGQGVKKRSQYKKTIQN